MTADEQCDTDAPAAFAFLDGHLNRASGYMWQLGSRSAASMASDTPKMSGFYPKESVMGALYTLLPKETAIQNTMSRPSNITPFPGPWEVAE